MSQQEQNNSPKARVDLRLLIPMAGILLAPFVGFLFDPNIGLGILILCLGIVGAFSWSVSQHAPPPQARSLRLGAILNGVLAVAALLLLLLRL